MLMVVSILALVVVASITKESLPIVGCAFIYVENLANACSIASGTSENSRGLLEAMEMAIL